MGRKTSKAVGKKTHAKIMFDTKELDKFMPKTQRRKQNKTKKSSHVVNDEALELMRKQLNSIGCKLHEVEADGNCLFRALADQIFGDQTQHQQARDEIVEYMEHQREDFEPFMEDEEKFEKYCERMRSDGTWGGNQELYAAARLFQVYVVVHQDQPSARIMVIECDRLKPTRFVHVAYHGEDHYDSVRRITDPVNVIGLPVPIELDCDGYRPHDFAKRWQTHASAAAAVDQLDQFVGLEPPTSLADDGIDRLASSLSVQLQVADETGHGATSKTMSKKEQRQKRKAAKMQKKLQSKLK
uniref:OTU domain-containing protein n=1 Tax=Peronospora matthiolae TaxID=2874970 RepID=A0AAV1UCS7_9STRA